MVFALPVSSQVVIVARGSSSFSSGRSYSSSYSSTRSSSSSGYSSTRTSSPSKSSSGYSSTRSSTPSKSSGYTSTRNTSPITRSNLSARTTPQQRTTVINNYHTDYVGYHSFFHPFGWGYGGGDFWFWMWLFDRPQYVQNQQIAQAQGINTAPPQNNLVQDIVFVIGSLVVLGLIGWGLVALWRHLRWI